MHGGARHRARRAHRRPRCTSPTSAPPAPSSWSATPSARGAAGHRRGVAASLHSHRRRRGGYNTNAKMNPPLRTDERRRRRCATGCATARSTSSPPTTRRTIRDEKEVEFDQRAQRHHRPRDRPAAGAAADARGRTCPLATLVRAMSINAGADPLHRPRRLVGRSRRRRLRRRSAVSWSVHPAGGILSVATPPSTAGRCKARRADTIVGGRVVWRLDESAPGERVRSRA